jgi:hypothetical protein
MHEKPHGRARHRLVNNIKIYTCEIVCEDVNFIKLLQVGSNKRLL